MHTIWILSLEPIETRYTAQWFAGVPRQIAAHAEAQGIAAQVHMAPAGFGQEAIDSGVLNIVNVPGDGGTQRASAGAFLNFATTNLWKNQQINRFIGVVEAGLVRDGDKVLVTDAWHPGILQLAYMRNLLDVSWDISAIWHAGSCDPWDFLGRAITDKRWSYATERALFWAIDRNFFTTSFHWGLFSRVLKIDDDEMGDHAAYSGYPNEYLWEELPPHRLPPEQRPNLILFPHRLAPEKQLDIFKDLAATLPQYDWVVCQEQPLEPSAISSHSGDYRIPVPGSIAAPCPGYTLAAGKRCNWIGCDRCTAQDRFIALAEQENFPLRVMDERLKKALLLLQLGRGAEGGALFDEVMTRLRNEQKPELVAQDPRFQRAFTDRVAAAAKNTAAQCPLSESRSMGASPGLTGQVDR